MSKYIKLEDAIEQVKTEFYGGGYQEWLEMSIDNLINRIANLPTIKVSEDCISRAHLLSKVYDMDNDNLVVDLKDIENAPSVVPQPKEGEWVKVDDSVQPICSKCGMSCSGIHRNADYSVVPTWKYCPNCGAKMRGVE